MTNTDTQTTEDLGDLDLDISSQVSEAPEPTDLKKAGPAPAHPETPREKPEPAPAHPENITTTPQPEGVGPQVKEPQAFSEPLTTKDGYIFDKRIIQCKPDGTPRTTIGGHWLLKKKGWQKGIEAIHQEQAEALRATTKQTEHEKETNTETNTENIQTEKNAAEPQAEKIPLEETPGVEPPPLAGEGNQETEPPPLEGIIDDPAGAMQELPNREIASLITDTFILKGISIVGSEFMPIQIDKNGSTDRDRLVDQWEAYLKTTATAEKLPPWAIPILGMLGYTSTRAMKPKSNTQSFMLSTYQRFNAKLKVMGLWVKAKFTGRTTAETLEDEKVKEAQAK